MAVTLGGGSNKLCIRVKRSRKDPYGYEKDALSRRVCYCRIIRKAYPEGWRYFLQLVLEGPPPVKVKPETGELLHAMGKGCVGLDVGPQTLAFSANKDVGLEELAEGVQLAQDEIRRIKRSMDRSRKNSNPKMFTADGQIVRKNKLPAECLNSRGRRIWVKTNRYKKMEMLLRSLYRKQAALRKHMHRRMANQLLAMGNEFYVEIGTPILEFIPPLHPVPLSMVTANAHLLKFFPKRCIIRLLLKKSIFVFRTEKRTRIF